MSIINMLKNNKKWLISFFATFSHIPCIFVCYVLTAQTHSAWSSYTWGGGVLKT